VIDVATGSSPDQEAAKAFFTTAAWNLQEVGERAGVRRIVVVSIIGIDHSSGTSSRGLLPISAEGSSCERSSSPRGCGVDRTCDGSGARPRLAVTDH
jgi:hypothetical protein